MILCITPGAGCWVNVCAMLFAFSTAWFQSYLNPVTSDTCFSCDLLFASVWMSIELPIVVTACVGILVGFPCRIVCCACFMSFTICTVGEGKSLRYLLCRNSYSWPCVSFLGNCNFSILSSFNLSFDSTSVNLLPNIRCPSNLSPAWVKALFASVLPKFFPPSGNILSWIDRILLFIPPSSQG